MFVVPDGKPCDPDHSPMELIDQIQPIIDICFYVHYISGLQTGLK